LPKLRLAPTPSGFLHIGNALNFLLTWLLAKKLGGPLHLRVDDLDQARVRPAYVQDVFDSLAWLGLTYNSGPRNAAELATTFSQHLRLDQYQAFLQQLQAAGHLYACNCSRKQIKALSPTGFYPGTCRQAGRSFQGQVAWRLATQPQAQVQWAVPYGANFVGTVKNYTDDAVLRRRDGLPAYHLANVVDDVALGINLIVRGADLLPSTALQVHLAQLGGQHAFTQARFVHHGLLVGQDGQKFSKSSGSTPAHQATAQSLVTMRGNGVAVGQVYTQCAQWLGIQGPAETLQQLLEAFNPEKHLKGVMEL